MLVNTIYSIGDIVYLKTDIDQHPRMVSQICIHVGSNATYSLVCGTTGSNHYEFEIQKEKDILKV